MRKSLPEALAERMADLGLATRVAAAKRISELGDREVKESRMSGWMKGSEPGPDFWPGLLKFLEIDQDTLGALMAETQMRLHLREPLI